MWYRYAQDQIWEGIVWSGPFNILLEQCIDPRLLKKLGLSVNNIWSVIVSDDDTYDIINSSINFNQPNDHLIEKGCFNSFKNISDEDKENLSAIGDFINCPDLISQNGIIIIKQDELDAALLAHEATHASRYRSISNNDYITNKEEIEAEISASIVERFLIEEGEFISKRRAEENINTFIQLKNNLPISYLALRNMFIKYIIKYSNSLILEKQYLNKLAMQINIFFKTLYRRGKPASANTLLSNIILSIMYGDTDPDDLLQNYENVMHDILFNELHDKGMEIKQLDLEKYELNEVFRMFEELIDDAYDAIEYKDYGLAQRLLDTIDSLFLQTSKRLKAYIPEYVSKLDERMEELDKQVPYGDIDENIEYPEHPTIKFKEMFENVR